MVLKLSIMQPAGKLTLILKVLFFPSKYWSLYFLLEVLPLLALYLF
jgi:hypothetical protein